ncbi:MAG: glycyl-radical enzyme activating protein [Armatimonadota bacterium]
MSSTGLITDIKKFAVHDGPGIRTTVFLKGCPLRCLWCHNPETQAADPVIVYYSHNCIGCGTCLDVCPNDALSMGEEGIEIDRSRCEVCGACVEACPANALEKIGREVTVEEVMAEVEKDRPFYETSGGGMTVSGGEPLQQIEFTRELLQAAQDAGIHTCLDTCGYAPWGCYEQVIDVTDLVLFDLKSCDPSGHRRGTGRSNSLILENLTAMTQNGLHVTVRTPVIPGFNDTTGAITAIAGFLKQLDTIPPLELLPFHQMGQAKFERLGMSYSLADAEPPTDELMHQLVQAAREYGVDCTTGN